MSCAYKVLATVHDFLFQSCMAESVDTWHNSKTIQSNTILCGDPLANIQTQQMTNSKDQNTSYTTIFTFIRSFTAIIDWSLNDCECKLLKLGVVVSDSTLGLDDCTTLALLPTKEAGAWNEIGGVRPVGAEGGDEWSAYEAPHTEWNQSSLSMLHRWNMLDRSISCSSSCERSVVEEELSSMLISSVQLSFSAGDDVLCVRVVEKDDWSCMEDVESTWWRVGLLWGEEVFRGLFPRMLWLPLICSCCLMSMALCVVGLEVNSVWLSCCFFPVSKSSTVDGTVEFFLLVCWLPMVWLLVS